MSPDSPHTDAQLDRIPVTVIVLAKNEEASLPDCLSSLRRYERVVVVDSGSSDRTADLATEAGADVVQFQWNGRYPKKKQWALENSSLQRPWALLLDADERSTPELERFLRTFLDVEGAGPSGVGAVDLGLRYVFLGRELKHGHKVAKRSLLKVDSVRFPEIDDLDVANMWEVEGHYQPVVKGRITALSRVLRHEDKDSLFDYFARHNRYSDWEASLRFRDLDRRVGEVRSRQGRLFARIPLKPVIFPIYALLIRRGLMDGIPGICFALAQAIYYAQIELKLRELKLAAREARD